MKPECISYVVQTRWDKPYDYLWSDKDRFPDIDRAIQLRKNLLLSGLSAVRIVKETTLSEIISPSEDIR